MKPIAYDSAYPGSMFPKEHGEYIERSDPASLAAALLEHITKLTRQVSDLEDALQDEKDRHLNTGHTLMGRCQELYQQLNPDAPT